MGIRLSAPGLVCCAGANREDFFRAALKGDNGGIAPFVISEKGRFLVGRVRGFDDPPEAAGARLKGTEGRLYRIAAAALEQISPEIEKAVAAFGAERVGVCAGSCDNGSELSFPAHREYFSAGAFPLAYDLRFQSAALVADFIAELFGLKGPCLTVSTACASSAGALVKGAELIRAGLCDAVVAGGADIVSETVLLGFSALEAVSDTLCNPFSRNRRGITLGEGAAFFVMRHDEGGGAAPGRAGADGKISAGADGPRIELLGFGESADAYHITAPRPDGSGAAAAMRGALSAAGIKPADVDYINLHGTGTKLNDGMEALATEAVFGRDSPPVSSTKPITGHTLGAAGALELSLCWMALAAADSSAPGQNGAAAVSGYGTLPMHRWDGEYDEGMPALHFVGSRGAAAKSGGVENPYRPINVCMSNSFAFGGCNTSLIIGRGVDNV
ncbi:MAG: 3-oxoacyl-ACP synthase [Treponema sp.]|jgi:3-oxoacyl-[acyl-carrier-protein] synthase-1|nr:3-oxoacyl-ACP synthase [Treponema sp.]